MNRCDLYRYVTFIRNGRKEEIANIAYANAFNYSHQITGLSDNSKLGSYSIHLDRSTGMLDKVQKMIFQNDYIKNDKNKVYRVDWCQEKLSFVLRTNNPEDTLESLDITWQKWTVVGNIYNNTLEKLTKIK